MINNDNEKEVKPIRKVVYVETKNETETMENIYNQLKIAVDTDNRNDIGQLVGAYFICDYYTLSNKEVDQIGGIDYFYNNMKALEQILQQLKKLYFLKSHISLKLLHKYLYSNRQLTTLK